MTDYLSIEDALSIAEELNFVVRDPGLLAGAIARPAASAFGSDAYPGFDRKVAALIESLNHNHALVDGNKRLSWVCAVIFAHLNGWTLAADQEQINDVIRRVAASRTSLDHLTEWAGEHLTAQ